MLTIKGTVVKGLGVAGTLFGTPTANLELEHSTQIEPGTYAAYTRFDGVALPSALYVNPEKKYETHVLDFSGELTGKTLEVDVLQYVSNYVPWESVEQMREKVRDDIAKVRTLFAQQKNGEI